MKQYHPLFLCVPNKNVAVYFAYKSVSKGFLLLVLFHHDEILAVGDKELALVVFHLGIED